MRRRFWTICYAQQKKGDVAELRRHVHSLRSNCATVGDNDLAMRCGALESLAATGRTDGVMELVAQITVRYRQAAEELLKMLRQL